MQDQPVVAAEPDARPSDPVNRFLRWLLEPPVRPQSDGMRVLRFVLRAVGWVLRGLIGDGTGGRYG